MAANDPQSDNDIDPVLVSIIPNRMDGIAEEMAQTLMMTSRSGIFAEARDFVTGILDSEGRLIAQSRYFPGFAGALPYIIPPVREKYGDTLAERQAFAAGGGRILHDGTVDQLASIQAFAGQIMGCDLVLTIDNSTAHVAGALGKPTWVLLHTTANWRWVKQREDSPWYPSLRLYRQDATGTWPPVLARVTADLRALAEAPA